MQALVVIDDPALAGWVTDYLTEQGFLVTSATREQEPLEWILDEQPDLAVLDLTAPRLQGLEMILKVRQHPQTASLPLIMFTTKEQLSSVYKGWQAGLDWFVLKPASQDDLNNALEPILNSRDAQILSAANSPLSPAAPSELADSNGTPGVRLSAAEPRATVLAIDDDQDIARLVATFLEAEGYSVALAFDATDALAHMRANRPDLLVLDVEMPGMSGLELLRQLRADPITATLPVVLLTGRDEISDLFDGWEAGASMYLTKPFEKQELLDAISTVLDLNAIPA